MADVHKFVLSIKLRSPPPGEKCHFEDFLLICTVFPHFGPFSGGAVFHHGGVPKNCPLTLMGRFPSLMGRVPEHLNGLFSFSKIPLIRKGEAFLLTIGAFVLTIKLLCIQSLKALLKHFPIVSKKLQL